MGRTPHLYLQPPWPAAEIPLSEGHAHHLHRVLRLSSGARVTYTDGAGTWGGGALGDGGIVRGEESRAARPDPSVAVGVAAPSKPARARFIVEKLAELGVDRLIWLDTRHGEGRPPRSDKATAWAIAALEQSQGVWLMEFDGPVSLDRFDPSTLWVAERESFPPPSVVNGGTLIIGPEAGFVEGEIPAQAKRLSLGSRILRVETAAVAGAVLLLEKSGRLSGREIPGSQGGQGLG